LHPSTSHTHLAYDIQKGCYTFVSDQKLRYACTTAKRRERKGDEVVVAVGLGVAVIAVVALSFALYYYKTIAPRLMSINEKDLLADPLVRGGQEMKTGIGVDTPYATPYAMPYATITSYALVHTHTNS
jgi:hypothetical protein